MKAIRCGTWCALAALALGTYAARAGELAQIPEAKDFKVIYSLDPLKWKADGFKYTADNSKENTGELKRVGYFLTLTDKQDKTTWAFVSMDAFVKEADKLAVPDQKGASFQQFVDNLEVASNVDGIKTGKFEKGNIEIWGTNYGPANAKNIPEASAAKFDFGDVKADGGNYGSLQVHNYLEKQTIIAFNRHNDATADLGLGNNPDEKGNPDWTFSSAAKNFKSAELVILGKF